MPGGWRLKSWLRERAHFGQLQRGFASSIYAQGSLGLALGFLILFVQAGCTRVISSGGDVIPSLTNSSLSARVNFRVVGLNSTEIPRVRATGGVPPYRFEIVSGSGTVDPSTGVFTPAAPVGVTTIRVRDSLGAETTVQFRSEALRTDGAVYTVAEDATHLYLGGAFSQVNPVPAPGLTAIDPKTGELDFDCDLGSGFGVGVMAVAVTEDAIFVGGNFTSFNGISVNRLAKLRRSDCQLDTIFSPAAANGFDQPVNELVIADGSLYVGGGFTSYRGVADSAFRIAKLDLQTGEIDTTFSPPGVGLNGFDDTVYALAVSGSSLFVGGSFTTYRGVADSALSIAKLNLKTGSIDTNFSPPGSSNNGFDGEVSDLLIGNDSLYVGGGFSNYRGTSLTARMVAKLDPVSGALDTVFSPQGAVPNGFDNSVHGLALRGKDLYAIGGFSSYRSVTLPVQLLAKIQADTGVLDPAFGDPAVLNAVSGLHTPGLIGVFDDAVYVGLRGRDLISIGLYKLDAQTGIPDPAFKVFHPFPGTMAVYGSSLLIGGGFQSVRGHQAKSIAKINKVTGEVDKSFSPAIPHGSGFDMGEVRAIVVSGDAVYVGGNLRNYNGVYSAANNIAKLNRITGELDPLFGPAGDGTNGFNHSVRSLVLSGNSLYAGGDFTAYRGVADSARNIAKIDLTTGDLDTTFSPPGMGNNGFNGTVITLAMEGTSLYVGGEFTAYRGVANSARNLAKLNLLTGAIDTTFSPPGATSNGFDREITDLVVAGNSLYVAGHFNHYRGVLNSANRIAKLNLTTGDLDTTFSPLGGLMNGFNGASYARISLAASGSALYVAGGNLGTYRNTSLGVDVPYLVKLDLGSGALDPSFKADGFKAAGFGMDLLVANGSLWMAGPFENTGVAGAAVRTKFVAPFSLTSGQVQD